MKLYQLAQQAEQDALPKVLAQHILKKPVDLLLLQIFKKHVFGQMKFVDPFNVLIIQLLPLILLVINSWQAVEQLEQDAHQI